VAWIIGAVYNDRKGRLYHILHQCILLLVVCNPPSGKSDRRNQGVIVESGLGMVRSDHRVPAIAAFRGCIEKEGRVVE
jgi:hypothetical protein